MSVANKLFKDKLQKYLSLGIKYSTNRVFHRISTIKMENGMRIRIKMYGSAKLLVKIINQPTYFIVRLFFYLISFSSAL